MQNQPNLILGTDKIANIQKVLDIYGEIAGHKKFYNDIVQKKMK